MWSDRFKKRLIKEFYFPSCHLHKRPEGPYTQNIRHRSVVPVRHEKSKAHDRYARYRRSPGGKPWCPEKNWENKDLAHRVTFILYHIAGRVV